MCMFWPVCKLCFMSRAFYICALILLISVLRTVELVARRFVWLEEREREEVKKHWLQSRKSHSSQLANFHSHTNYMKFLQFCFGDWVMGRRLVSIGYWRLCNVVLICICHDATGMDGLVCVGLCVCESGIWRALLSLTENYTHHM